MVYRQGTSKSLTTTVGVGSFGGGAAYGQAFSEGFHQSLLSRDVAPPTQRGLVGPISAAVFGALLLAAGGAAAMNDGGNAAAAALVFGVMLLLGGWWLAGQASAYNRNTFPEALAEWEQSFICFRCGEVFTPGKDRGADAYDGDDADTV